MRTATLSLSALALGLASAWDGPGQCVSQNPGTRKYPPLPQD
jgi:hypothetical protein